MAQTRRISGLGAVKPHVKAAAEEIAPRFDVWNIGGFATSGHITNSDHYKGLALDVMTMTDMTKGGRVAEYALVNAGRWGVTYVIWNKRIWDSRDNKGWVAYFGSSPHTDHVHISFKPEGGTGGSAVDTGMGSDVGAIGSGIDWRTVWQSFVDWFFGGTNQ